MIKKTICDPLRPEVIDAGTVSAEHLIDEFRQFPWEEMLKKQSDAPDEKVCFSPSLGFEDIAKGKGIEISVVPDEKGYVFYLFYSRKQEVNKGLIFKKRVVEQVVSDLLDRSIDDCLKLIELFQTERFDEIEAWFSSNT